MEIREIKLNEITELSVLAQKTYAETFGHSFTTEELETELKRKSEEYFLEAIQDRNENFLGAFINNRIIAYVGLRSPDLQVTGRIPKTNDQALNGIYVLKELQGQGIGKKLMNAAFKHPRFESAENIYLIVWEENKKAYNFYLSYGFEPVGIKEVVVNGQSIGHDTVMMKANKKPA